MDINKFEQFVKEAIDICEQFPLLEHIAFKKLNKKYKKEDCITEYLNYETGKTIQTSTDAYFNQGYDNYHALYYSEYSEKDILLLNDLSEDIKSYIMSIMNNFNLFKNVNNLNMNDQWLNTLKNLTPEQLSEKLFITNENYTDKIKLKIDNISNYTKTLIGGYNQLEALGINETYIHRSTRITSKYLSTSLFDRGSSSVNKNINHYSLCLFLAFILYKRYLPDFNMVLYIDESISTSSNQNVIELLNYLKTNETVDIILVKQQLNDISIIDKNGKNTIGLYGAFYRFFIYLNPNVETIVMVDADNYPTERFCDYVKDFDSKSKEETIGIFKPLFYMRKNINNDCIPQILAGMHMVKKKNNTIMNPKIFGFMYDYMNIQYSIFKTEFSDFCDSNVKIKYSTPFQFGFEENAFTNIVMPYFLNLNIIIYPLFFDFGKGFNFYYNELLLTLKPNILEKIDNSLSLNINNSKNIIFCLPENSFNIFIGIIFTGYLYKCLKNNIDIFINEEKKNKAELFLSIGGFYHIYPAFNLQMNIFSINEYIDDLYNNKPVKKLELLKLTKEAYNEFNKDTYNYYKDIVDEKIQVPNTLPILEEGFKNANKYKNKYLKYKNKYLYLKKQTLNNKKI